MTNSLIRHSFWAFFVSVWVIFEVIAASKDFDDCLAAYALDTGIAIVCFILFAWWWAKNGKPSPVYVCVTFLFGGIVLSRAMELYARYLYVHKAWSDYYQFLEGPYWSWRGFPRFIAMAYMASLIFTRLITNREDG